MLYSFFLITINVGCSSAFRPRYPTIYYRTIIEPFFCCLCFGSFLYYCRGAENGIKCICIVFHVAEKKISELRRNILHVSAVNIISLTDKLFLGENSMEAIVYRERRAKNYFYEDESGVLAGESNCTFGIALSRAILYRGNEGVAIVQEKCAALKLLSKLLLDIVQLAPYELHYKEAPICSLRLSMSLAPKFTGKIGEHFFELRMHSGNICSLMRDSIQIAKFTKRAKSEFERNIYDVIYLNE